MKEITFNNSGDIKYVNEPKDELMNLPIEEHKSTIDVSIHSNRESAFPEPFVNSSPHLSISHTPGMSKRCYIACAAMQGLLATGQYEKHHERVVVKKSFILADEFLEQEKL